MFDRDSQTTFLKKCFSVEEVLSNIKWLQVDRIEPYVCNYFDNNLKNLHLLNYARYIMQDIFTKTHYLKNEKSFEAK